MGEVIKALVLSACKIHDHTVTRLVSVTPLYLKRSTQYLAPKPLLSDLQRAITRLVLV